MEAFAYGLMIRLLDYIQYNGMFGDGSRGMIICKVGEVADDEMLVMS